MQTYQTHKNTNMPNMQNTRHNAKCQTYQTYKNTRNATNSKAPEKTKYKSTKIQNPHLNAEVQNPNLNTKVQNPELSRNMNPKSNFSKGTQAQRAAADTMYGRHDVNQNHVEGANMQAYNGSTSGGKIIFPHIGGRKGGRSGANE